MYFARLLDFSWWGLAVQLTGAMILFGFVITAWVSLCLGRKLVHVRSLVADGVIACLGMMTAATLLKTVSLRTWRQILVFAVVFSLRLLLKRLFVWEKKQFSMAQIGAQHQRVT